MSPSELTASYQLQTFHFSHRQSNGADVYNGRWSNGLFRLNEKRLITTLWTDYGPVGLRALHIDDLDKGALIQLEKNDCEILLQKQHTPNWMGVFNFTAGPVIVVPIHPEAPRFKSLQRIMDKTMNDDERENTIQSVTQDYHLIIPTRPGRSPAPRPRNTHETQQLQAA